MKRKKSLSFVLLLSGSVLFSSAFAQSNVVKLVTSKKEGEKLTLMVNKTYNGVTVDWGNGEAVAYKTGEEPFRVIEGTLKGQAITISGDAAWTTLSCANNQITSIDLTQAQQLRSLYCQDNELTTLDLRNMELLTDLDCANNQLTEIVFTDPTYPEKDTPLMENYNISNNQLKGYDETKQIFAMRSAPLQHVNISGNQFKVAYFIANTQLVSANMANNQLSSISLSNNQELVSLICHGNELTKITMPKNKGENVTQIIADDNLLTTLDISAAEGLTDISVANNRLTAILMPDADHIETINVSGNNLGLGVLPSSNKYVRSVIFEPQGRLDISKANGIVMKENIPTVPVVTYAERNENPLDLSEYRKLAGSDRPDGEIKWYAIDEQGDAQELVLGKTASAPNDYSHSAGKFAFFTAHKKAYAEITSAKYGVKVQTIPIVIGDDVTAIESVVTSPDNAQFGIYDLQGRVVKKSTNNFNGLQRGIYVVNGKKVMF